MTEALPVTDIALAEIDAAGPGDGVCVGRPLPGVGVRISPLVADGAADRPADRRAGRHRRDLRSRAPHVKDRYDQLWAHRARRARATRAGTAPATSGTSTPTGRLWVEGRLAHVIVTADRAGARRSGSSSGCEAVAGVDARRRRRRGPARHAAGGGRRRDGAGPRPAGAPAGSPTRSPTAVRAAAGVAGRRRAASPTRCPPTSGTTRRSTAPGWRRGPSGCWPAGAPGAGREGAGHGRERHARRRGRRARWPPAATTSRVLQRGPSGLPGTARCSATSPTRRAVGRGRRRRQDAVVHLAAKVDVTGPLADFAARERRRHPHAARRRPPARASRRFVHVSSPSVAHAGASLVGRGAGAGRPGARPRPLRPEQGDGRAARAGRRRADARRRRRPAAPGLGPGDTQLVGRILDRARAGRLPVVGTGAALIDTTYVDNAVDALVAALDRAPDAARPGARGLQRRAAAGRRAARRRSAPRPASPAAAARRAAAGSPGSRRRRRRGGVAAPGGRRAADDPVPRRAAVHRALVRPARHPRGAGLGTAGRARRGLPRLRTARPR